MSCNLYLISGMFFNEILTIFLFIATPSTVHVDTTSHPPRPAVSPATSQIAELMTPDSSRPRSLSVPHHMRWKKGHITQVMCYYNESSRY
jgi:hypothetical protein